MIIILLFVLISSIISFDILNLKDLMLNKTEEQLVNLFENGNNVSIYLYIFYFILEWLF
jgi:hypothetical protein